MAEQALERRGERGMWWPDFMPRRLLDWIDGGALEHVGEHVIRVEELHEDGDLVIRAEMPGIDPEHDVEVHVRDHMLEISAQRTQRETKDDKGARRSELRYGSFYRALSLPATVKESEIQASYKDGILKVRAPSHRSAVQLGRCR